jgi:transglutaminase-like putative cysteine protease
MRRSVRFTYEVSVGPSDAPTLVWVPRPIDDEWQRVIGEALPPNVPSERGRDEETGTSMLQFTLPAARDEQRLEVSFTVERRERQHAVESGARYARPPQADGRMAAFLRSDARVRTDGPTLERARAIASMDEPPLVIARKIYDHLLATLDYDSRGCTPDRAHELGDLEMACDLRSGTCTEFHGLFVAYARALGVPARFTFGYNIPRGKTEGSIAGYHCWADIAHPDGTWFPLDVSEAWKRRELVDFYFGALDANRVAFTYGRDLQLVPPQSAPRLDRFIMPYAESGGAEVYTVLAFRFSEV